MHGPLSDLRGVRDLLAEVGSGELWQWVRVGTGRPDGTAGAYVQVCGAAATATLAVEISNGGWPVFAATRAAPSTPLHQIDTHGWHYLAHPDELHDVEAAFGILTGWLVDHKLDGDRFEPRSTRHREAVRQPQGDAE